METIERLSTLTQQQLENIYSLDFARFIKATISNGGGVLSGFDAFRERHPRALTLQVKAAVNPGTIAEPSYAAPLAQLQPAINAVVRRAHALSILGRLQGYRSVPFNVTGAFQTGSATYSWIGEGAPKNVSNLQYTAASMTIAKAAGIIVLSAELARLGSDTAISRMIEMGIDDHTVMAISGHQSVRMLERYTHPTTARKLDALTVDLDGQNEGRTESETLEKAGGRREARTRGLRIANAALSQLS